MDLLFNPLTSILISLIVLIYSAILHEIAHGFVAEKMGDPTARLLGRITLNPKPHIDPMMSIALPLILILSGSPVVFGGAKPVPVDPFNLRDGRKDIALVSLAGPMTNIIIAVFAAILLHTTIKTLEDSLTVHFSIIFLREILETILRINLLLAIFNLLPVPPLDGSKVFALLLPEKSASAYLSIGSLGSLLIFMLLLLPTGISELIGTIYRFCLTLLGF